MTEITGKYRFFCPHCGGKLSFLDGTVLKLVGRLHAEQFSCKAMFYIPARLGAYGAIVGEGVRVRDGAKIEFECIHATCKRNLSAAYDDTLAEIRMVDEEGGEFVVVFNKIFGRKATFVIDHRSRALLRSFGEDAGNLFDDMDRQRNFFGS